jgi:hypothetical protein
VDRQKYDLAGAGYAGAALRSIGPWSNIQRRAARVFKGDTTGNPITGFAGKNASIP